MTCPHPEKHKHRTIKAALAARDSLESERGVDLALRPYRCGDHWHLGHKGDKGLAARVERALKSGNKAAFASRRGKK